MTFLTSLIASQAIQYGTGVAGVALIGYILKKIPNEKIKDVIGKFFYGLGVALTLGLSKYSWSKPFWNKIVEPWFIDLVDNVIGEAVRKFIAGLRSDNG